MEFNNASIITVRNNSKRLPKKTIMKIKNEHTALDIIILRCKKMNLPIILATTTDTIDDSICEIGKKYDIEIFRGSAINKIKRWYDCFKKYKIHNALLIDGDDLCYDFEIGKRAMVELNKSEFDIISSPENIITGLFTLAVTNNAIERLYSIASDDSLDTDLFTHLFSKANLKINNVSLMDFERDEKIRLTLDYEEDLEFFKKLYQIIDITERGEKIIEILKKNQKLISINYHKQEDFINNKKIKEEKNG